MDINRKTDIQRVAKESGSAQGRGVMDSYAWEIEGLEQFPEDNQKLTEYLQGKVLLDLGAGINCQEMAKYAAKAGVANYIAVDSDYLPDLGKAGRDRGYVSLKTDALTFLSGQPDSSANITMNAVGDLLLTETLDYQRLLIEEMVRVVGEKGIVFGGPGGHFLDKLVDKGFTKEFLVGFILYHK